MNFALAGSVHLLLYIGWRRRPKDVYEGRPEAFPPGFGEPPRPENRLLTSLVCLSVAALALGLLAPRLLNLW